MITGSATTLLTDNCSQEPLDQESQDSIADVDEIWEQMEDAVVDKQST